MSVFGLALPMVAIHKIAPVDAMRICLRKAQEQLTWHIVFGLLGFVLLIVVQYIPIIGLFYKGLVTRYISMEARGMKLAAESAEA